MTDQTPRYRTGLERDLGDPHAQRQTDWRDPALEGDGELRGEHDVDRERSTIRLLRELVGDVAVLFRKELALATSEVRHSVTAAGRGVGSMVGGGAVLFAGLLFLLAAAAFGLALFMPAWAATLIVGAVVALIGLVMVLAGKSKLDPHSFAPDRTADSWRKDKDAIRRHTS